MKRKWIVTAGILVVFIAGVILYNVFGSSSTEATGERTASSSGSKNILHVNGEIVRQQRLTNELYSFVNLLPDEEVNLSFETSGKIVSINFQEGSFVQKGQLLAKINDAPLQAQLSRYEAQVKLAEARVRRQSTLLEKDAVSQEAVEQATTELATLNADIALVKANIAQTELRAPFDGIIGLRNISEGAYASPSVVIARLTKTSPLKLEFSVPAVYASEIKTGMPLTFTPEGFLEPLHAVVYATESRIDQDMRTLQVHAIYPNLKNEAIPGTYTRLTLQLSSIPNAITIPSEALISEMGIGKVFLYKNGKAQPQNVNIGLRTAGRVQVVEGLHPGDTLITSGTLQLRTGIDVVLDYVNPNEE